MKKISLTSLLALLALSSFFLTGSPQREKAPDTDHSNLSFSVCDYHHEQELLNSQKENITNRFSQQKIKFFGIGLFQSGLLNYYEFRSFHQTISTHTFILGHTTALRAPPRTFLS